MARTNRRSVRSTKPDADALRRSRERERAAIEDTLFFSRLRRHAKWMFVFLALAFGFGFVLFNIGGSGSGGGIGDLLRDGGGQTNGGVSVSDARKDVEKRPKSPDALRTLATALEEDGQTAEAAVILTRYIAVKPKDEEALRELAGLHLRRATALAQSAQAAQARAASLTIGSTFSVPLQLGKDGSTLGPDPIQAALSAQTEALVNDAYTKAQTAYTEAEATYERLVAVVPNDPNVQLELAQASQQSGNYAKAIAAYERFLELAPDDPSAPIVKQQIAQLKAAQAGAGSG